MAEPDAAACRRNAEHWSTLAAEADLANVREARLASAAAWIARAEQIEKTSALRAERAAR